MADSNGDIHLSSESLGLPKLSDIISEFSVPLYGEDDVDEMHDFVCCCWNIGAYPEDISDLLWGMMIEPVLKLSYDDPGSLLRKKLKNVVHKRRTEHADDPRFITEFHLEPLSGNEMHLQIASQAMSPEKFLLRLLANAPDAMQKIYPAS